GRGRVVRWPARRHGPRSVTESPHVTSVSASVLPDGADGRVKNRGYRRHLREVSGSRGGDRGRFAGGGTVLARSGAGPPAARPRTAPGGRAAAGRVRPAAARAGRRSRVRARRPTRTAGRGCAIPRPAGAPTSGRSGRRSTGHRIGRRSTGHVTGRRSTGHRI